MEREFLRQAALDGKQLGRIVREPAFEAVWGRLGASVAADFKSADTDDKRRDVWATMKALDRLRAALDAVSSNAEIDWPSLKD